MVKIKEQFNFNNFVKVNCDKACDNIYVYTISENLYSSFILSRVFWL